MASKLIRDEFEGEEDKMCTVARGKKRKTITYYLAGKYEFLDSPIHNNYLNVN